MLSTDSDIRRLVTLRAAERGLSRLKWLAAATRFEIPLARHDRALKAGFNPDQPRDDHGQWTDGGRGTRAAANDGPPGLPVDLGNHLHVLAEHVKSQQYVLARVRDFAERARRLGDTFEGLYAGSFSSLEAANKLVNSTIGQNQAKVDQVVSGVVQYDELEARFDSPTGYEGYIRSPYSQAELRDTYGVKVVIRHDPYSSNGYNIVTAFPVH
jgi:hypothetical protein